MRPETELLKNIYEKYPRTYELLFNKYNNLDIDDMIIVFTSEMSLFSMVPNEGCNIMIIPFNMLYGLLEDFFEDNGIYIEIFLENRIDRQYWNYQIRSDFFNCGSGVLYLDKKIYTKTEAKIQAILKACEILEKTVK